MAVSTRTRELNFPLSGRAGTWHQLIKSVAFLSCSIKPPRLGLISFYSHIFFIVRAICGKLGGNPKQIANVFKHFFFMISIDV